MGVFRVAKQFEIDTGHRLRKHPGRCRHPHGHTRRIEVVLRGERLDDRDMVCDYKALKIVVSELVEPLDHAMLLSADDPELDTFRRMSDRVVVLGEHDPTTEVMARWLFEKIAERISGGTVVVGPEGHEFPIPDGVEVERVRIWESSTSWSEYTAAP